MNMRTDLSKKNSTKYSRQRRKKAESLKRTLVLLLATAFLLSMPLGAYMVSASDGVTPDPAAVTGTDPAAQPAPAPAATEVPAEQTPETPAQDPVQQSSETDSSNINPTVINPEQPQAQPNPAAGIGNDISVQSSNGQETVNTVPAGNTLPENSTQINALNNTESGESSPSPTPEQEKTASVVLYEEDPEKENIYITVNTIPQSFTLKAEELKPESQEYTAAINAVNASLAAEPNGPFTVDTVYFALNIGVNDVLPPVEGGRIFNITIQGKILGDIASESLLYSINEQNQAVRMMNVSMAQNYIQADQKLSFDTDQLATFVLAVPTTPHVHSMVEYARKEPTCAQDGYEAYWTCKECGKMFSDSAGTVEITEIKAISKTGHTFDNGTVTKAATCTEDGVKTCKCTNAGCTETKTETIPKTGHSFDNGTVTKVATCTEDGVRTYKCTNTGCKETRTETISRTGHALTAHAKKAADCTQDGYEAYWSCSRCNKLFSDSAGTKEIKAPVVIRKTGHTPGSPVVENKIEPKVGQAGSYEEVVYCKTCKKEISRKTVAIDALPAPDNKGVTSNITFNKDGESGMVSASAENAPANAYLSIRSVDPSVIELVESSRIKNKTTGEAERYDVWFGVDVSLGMTPANSVTITLQSQKLASLPDGALLYHVNPLTNKVRKTAYTYSKAEGKISFKSRDFSPFVILVKHDSSRKSNNDDAKDAAADNNIVGGAGVPTYGPVGDNGTGYSGYGGYNGTGAHMTLDANDTSVLDGMGGANATGVNDTKAAGFNDTKYAGENGTNTTNTTMGANVTEESNSTGVNKTAVKEKDSGNSSGGLSTGAVIGIIAAIVAAAAVAFGVYRYLKNGRREEE